MRVAAFLLPTATLPNASNSSQQSPSVPPSPIHAAKQLSTALQTALLSGKRRLQTDVLTAAIDPRSRIYDVNSASIIFSALVNTLHPINPLKIVVSGSTAALRVRNWLTESNIEDVTVSVLGVSDAIQQEERHSSLLVLDPPGEGDAMTDLRKLLQQAHAADMPIVVHNHPRQNALYSMLGFGGAIPRELFQYHPAFVLAPFALEVRRGDGAQMGSTAAPPRFVLMRQFPHVWQLWRFLGEEGFGIGAAFSEGTTDSSGGDSDMYVLVEQFKERPSDGALMNAIRKALSNG